MEADSNQPEALLFPECPIQDSKTNRRFGLPGGSLSGILFLFQLGWDCLWDTWEAEDTELGSPEKCV